MRKFYIFVLLIIGISFIGHELQDYLTFSFLKMRHQDLLNFYAERQLIVFVVYFFIYFLVTAFSIPGAMILSLGAGAIFGVVKGTLLVSFASSMGATVALLLTRYFFKDFFFKKFRQHLLSIQKEFDKNGLYYLLTLRLVPVFPFFLINIAMAFTNMKWWFFYLVSQLGMLLGTLIYVNAGTQLSSIQNTAHILTPEVLFSLSLIGIFPILTKKIIGLFAKRKNLLSFNRPKKFDYNIIVIGGGAAGLVSSYIASSLKARVCLIEKNKMGGECLNTGCVPSKSLIKYSRLFWSRKKLPQMGMTKQDNFLAAMNYVREKISKISPHDSIERYSSMGVECLTGEAEIISPFEIKINEKIISGKNLIFATGSQPFIPDIPGLHEIPFYTSENIWTLTELPQRLLVLGGGGVSCELSQAFSRLGSKVDIVIRNDRLMSQEDQDVSQQIFDLFTRDGINIFTSHELLSFSRRGDEKILITQSNGKKYEFVFDTLLLALGRRGFHDIPGIKKLDINFSEDGTYEHDEFLRTKYENIFVAGDCAGPYQFSHMASHQAWYASINALFSPFKLFKVDYSLVPRVIFLAPEIARVGYTEKEAREREIEYEVTKYFFDDLDRAIIDEETVGFVKILTYKDTDKILGAVIFGSHAGEMLGEIILAMKYGIGLNKILSTIHPYLTYSESLKYVAGIWRRSKKPEKVLSILESYHKWRRS